MKTYQRLVIVAGLSIGCGSLPLRANLITNGSFETPTAPVGGFTLFGSGSSGITGWTVVGAAGGVGIVNGTFAQGCCTFPAEDGVQWVDLTGLSVNSAEGVQQIVSTTPGTSYTLTFWVGNINDPSGVFGSTSTVKVLVGGIAGTLIDTATNSSTTLGTQIWQQFTTSFTATGSTTTLDFINADPGSDNSNGLDNVVLNPSGVPEPGTFSLLLIGAAGLGLFRRVRTHSA